MSQVGSTSVETLRHIHHETGRTLDAAREEYRSSQSALETLSAASGVALALFTRVLGQGVPNTAQTAVAVVGAVPVVVIIALAARALLAGARSRVGVTGGVLPSRLPDERTEERYLEDRTKDMELEIDALIVTVRASQNTRRWIELALAVELVYLVIALLVAPHLT